MVEIIFLFTGDILKIILYCINFSPELTGIGKYTGELAHWLDEQGHDIRVVTAPPYYPQWKVVKGYKNFWSCSKESITVYRCPLWVPAKPTGVKRVLHLMSFALSSLPVMLKLIFWKPDVVWVVEPPLFCAPIAGLVARASGAKSWLHIQDYELDAAFDLGLIKGERIRRWAQAMEQWLMQRFDMGSSISKKMLDLAQVKGIARDDLRMFPNWVDLTSFNLSNIDDVNSYRNELGVSDDDVVVLYSGNMGAKQGLEILADAARICAEIKNIIFVFCGDGAGRTNLVKLCSDLLNVRWLTLQPLIKLPALLKMADIHLLPQRADAADLVMPSKLTGMFASGRSVIATVNEGTELHAVLSGNGDPTHACGLTVPPGNSEMFADSIIRLVGDIDLRDRLGIAGYRYAQQYLDKEIILKKFEADLENLISRNKL